MKEYFCLAGHQFDRHEVRKWLHEPVRGDLPSHGITMCPYCSMDVIKKLSEHFFISDKQVI